MSTHKYFDQICCMVFAVTLLITAAWMHAPQLGVQEASLAAGYESRLFDASRVHAVDLVMDDWEEFLEGCTSEEYSVCTVVIDGETCRDAGIRAKGNTSLTQVAAYGNDRYSFKIEFDHYDSSKSYYGLDKVCLNNIIQDNTYMKDYLTYQMMAQMGVASSLCSFVNLSVNGEVWGLYLAVEGVEDAFLSRNYGADHGSLYKPDSQKMDGGARGEWEPGNMPNARGEWEPGNMPGTQREQNPQDMPYAPDGGNPQDMPGAPDGWNPQDMPNAPESRKMRDMPDAPEQGGIPGDTSPKDAAMGQTLRGMPNQSDDLLLKYIDEETDSYSNIFDHAKTNVSKADKKRLIQSLRQLSGGENIAEVVDVEQVIRYFVVHNFVLNFDSYTGTMIHNYYLYEKDGQMAMIPWDYNLAFGGFDSDKDASELVNFSIDEPVSGGDVSDRPMLAWIFSDESYQTLYHQYFSAFITDYFDSGTFARTMDEVEEMISPYVKDDPTKFCTEEEFKNGFDTLRQFCLLRAQSVRGQLDEPAGEKTWVDADDLDVSAMGSMNRAMGGKTDRH